MTPYLIQFVVVFAMVALKGFQYKNIQGNHYKLVAATSFLMAASEVIAVGLIVTNGGWSILPAGAGATLGIVSSMWAHDRLVKNKDKP